MASEQPYEATIFNVARKIESSDERHAYLTKACGDDAELRARVEKLVCAFMEESQFLEQPAPGLAETMLPDSIGDNLAASLDAGLAVTFHEESAVVIGDANHSVLKSISNSLGEVPHVSLRDASAEGEDSILRPSSPEVPNQQHDSRYRLDGEIARGGMGAIIRGRDTDLGRDLAIKVLLDSHKDQPEVVQRFIEEAQIGGQLQHPGIVPVYELGQFSDKRPFFSMKLVKGKTLAALLAKRKDSAEDRPKLLGIFEQVCQTMAYAHSKGVIHRDLKPANIMVGAFGEVQVMDWGLAKVLSVGGIADETRSQEKHRDATIIRTRRSSGSETGDGVGSDTQMGSVMGTPAYMPPEQALGEVARLDERADVFGLGAILCEILTGKPPYVGASSTEVFRKSSRGKLEDCHVRLQECDADREVVDLAKSMLAAEPEDRPANAGVATESISNYLTGVQDRLKESELAKVRSDGRRNLYRAIAVLTVLIALVLAFAGWRQTQLASRNLALADENDAKHREASEQRDAADIARSIAEQNATEYRQKLYASLIPQAESAIRAHQRGHALQVLEECPPELRGWEWDHLYWRTRPRFLFTIDGKALIPRFNSSGEMINHSHSGMERVVRTWNIANGELVREYPMYRVGRAGRDGSFFLNYRLGGGSISRTETLTGRRAWEKDNPEKMLGNAVISLDGSTFITRNPDAIIRLWSAHTGETLAYSDARMHNARRPEYSPDSTRLAVGYQILDATNLEQLVELDAATESVTISGLCAAAWSPNGERILTGDGDGRARIWDARTGKKLRELGDPVGRNKDLAWSSDGQHIAIATVGKTILRNLEDESAGQLPVATLSGTVTRVEFTPNGDKIVCMSGGGYRVWNARSQPDLVELAGHENPVVGLAFSLDGRFMASAEATGTIKIWDVNSRTAMKTIPGKDRIDHIVWLRGGLIATAASNVGDTPITLRDVSTGSIVKSLLHNPDVHELSASPDGKYLAASSHYYGTIRVWEVETLTQLYEFEATHSVNGDLTWTPDSRQIVSVSGSGYMRSKNFSGERGVIFRDAATGDEIHRLQGSTRYMLACSPTGDRLVCGKIVRDAATGEELVRLRSSIGTRDVQFLDDERVLLTDDLATAVMNARTGDELLTLPGRSMAVSPDRRTIATANNDGTITLWETGPPLMSAAARQVSERARYLVDERMEALTFSHAVVDFLQDDKSLDPAVRAKAIDMASDYHDNAAQFVRAREIHNECLKVVSEFDHDETEYHEALGNAVTASRVLPASAIYRSTLGIAQYRVGQFDEALETLKQAEKRFAEMHPDRDYPPIVAFKAMTLHQLGKNIESREHLDRLQRWFDEDRWGGNRELYAQYQREAKKLIIGADSEVELK